MQILWPATTNPPEISPDEAHAWAAPLVVDDAARKALWDTLAPDERERADDFRSDELRRRFVVARGTLRKLLGQYLNARADDVEIIVDDCGKPRLGSKHAVSNLRFNLSHSGDLALIAIAAGCEVGIDVEHVRAVGHLNEIARRYFHPAEIEAILATAVKSRNGAFLGCWTAKEAVLKACGTGITLSLNAFQVPLAESFEGWIDLSRMPNTVNNPHCWLSRLIPNEICVAAAAFLGSKRHLRCFAFSA